MTCEEIRRLILENDENPPFTGDPGLVQHLAICPECRNLASQLQEVSAMLHQLPQIEPSSRFNARTWEKINQARRRHVFIFPVSGRIAALAAAVTLIVSIAVVVVAVSRRAAPPGPVQWTETDERDSELLLQIDDLIQQDEGSFLQTFEEWETSSGDSENPSTPGIAPEDGSRKTRNTPERGALASHVRQA